MRKFVRQFMSIRALVAIILAVSVYSVPLHAAPTSEQEASNSSKSTIGILVFDGFLTSDVTAPLEIFGAATKKPTLSSHQVVLISATKNKTLRSEEGLAILADKTIFDDIKLDVLIVPSAYDMAPLLKNKPLIQFIKSQSRQVAWLASNCSGAFLLGEAGSLDGKAATTWAGGEGDLAKAYPTTKVVHDKNVVVDGNIVTSNGGPVSYQAALSLLAAMTTKSFADDVSKSIQFNRLETAFSE